MSYGLRFEYQSGRGWLRAGVELGGYRMIRVVDHLFGQPFTARPDRLRKPSGFATAKADLSFSVACEAEPSPDPMQ